MPANRQFRASAATKFYAVKAGKKPGVYNTWAECQAMTTGYKGASYKSFPSRKEAEDYVAGRTLSNNSANQPIKFYGVAVGKKPGVYTSWDEAQAQIVGWKGPKYKRFETRGEAEAFVRSGGIVIATSDSAPAAAKSAKRSHTEVESDADGATQPETKSRKTSTKAAPPTDEGKEMTIYTDGSSRGNGQRGASAGLGVFFGVNDPRNVSERLEGEQQTNQRAELTAILRAVEIPHVSTNLHIISDSNYSIKCVTQWHTGWRRNGWKNSRGEPVVNRDVIESILARIEARTRAGSATRFSWIKGHNDDAGNVAADKLAVAGAMKPQRG